MSSLTIGELAKQAGVGVETIRFYERKGLIARPPRPRNGYRRYEAQVAERIRFIRQAQELGFTLMEIAQLLALRVDPRTSCADVKGKSEEKIAGIDGRIRGLRRMRDALVKITRTCSGAGPTGDCPILDFIAKERR